jgi:tetratricopeptide (TPR) repeat protein
MKKGNLGILAVLLLGIVLITLASLLLTDRRREQKSSRLRELFLDGDHETVIEISAEEELSDESLYLAGLSSYALGNYEQAVRKLELFLVLYADTDTAYVHEIIGLSFKNLKEYQSAAKHLELSEKTPDVYAHLLVCYSRLGDTDALEQTIRDFGLQHTAAVLYSVEALARQKQYAEAIGLIVDAQPEGYFPYAKKLAELHLLHGEPETALPIIQKASASTDLSNEQRAQLFVLLGDVYYSMGRLVEARSAWKQAADIDKNNREAQQRL